MSSNDVNKKGVGKLFGRGATKAEPSEHDLAEQQEHTTDRGDEEVHILTPKKKD